MTAKRFSFPATLTLAVALALGVTACSPDSKAAGPTPTASASAPAVTDPTEAPAPEIPSAHIGGEQIPIDPTLPLPETVVEAVRATTSANAEAIAAASPNSDGANDTPEASVAITSAISNGRAIAVDLSKATGRTVFIVAQVWLGDDASFYQMKWVALSDVNNPTQPRITPSTDKDKVVAGINAWIAAQTDPSAYEVVIS